MLTRAALMLSYSVMNYWIVKQEPEDYS
ncbi:MAG: hypothetical protein JWO95_917, partial [Verrucomicrobiales bacterium]|nr:hypothetical protein [Verrucomicrobiales bacterium]